MAVEVKGKEPSAKAESGRPETAEELLARAAALLEQRGGQRQKTFQSAAEKVRAVLERLEGLK
jgi:hypothetical protein